MSSIFVIVDFATFWIHATGAGGGADVDVLADRDADGFPILRGRHARGVLREASRRIDGWSAGWESADRLWDSNAAGVALTDLLFGTRTQAVGVDSVPGCLDIRDFHLPQSAKSTGAAPDPALAPFYFRRIAATAIEQHRGTARNKTLRAVEAGVPCPLGGWISFAERERLVQRPRDEPLIAMARSGTPPLWQRHVQLCLTEARSFGANRTRGYGRTRFDPAAQVFQGGGQ
jgi:hypothetical protein